MSWLEGNLQALERAHPGMGRMLRERFVPSDDLTIESSASGGPTARRGGRYLHSPRNPGGEAKRLIGAQSLPECLIIFGFGLGYYLEAIIEEGDGLQAIVVVADGARFLQSLSVRDLRATLCSETVQWLVEAPPQSLPSLLQTMRRKTIRPLKVAALFEQDRDYLRQVESVVMQFLATQQINANTFERFAHLWVRNVGRNLPLLTRMPAVSLLRDRFSGVPAVAIGAGPSLDDLSDLLGEIRERALLIATDTALSFLSRRGIAPDFVVVVDPQYWNSRHLDWASLGASILISELSAHPRIFRLLRGDILFCGSPFPLGMFLERAVGSKGQVGAGGSVATTAWDIARLSGASSIWLAGVDLGFPGGRTHCRGSWFEERIHLRAGRMAPAEQALFDYLHDGDLSETEANDGGRVLTDRRMRLYLHWFEAQQRLAPDRVSHTVSPTGAAIAGMPFCPATRLLEARWLGGEIDRGMEALRMAIAAFRQGELDRRRALYVAVDRLLDGLGHIEAVAERGARIVERLEGTPAPETTRLWRELDDIDDEMRSLPHRDIAGFLIPDIARAIAVRRQSTVESTLANSSALYRGIVDSVGFHRNALVYADPHHAPDGGR